MALAIQRPNDRELINRSILGHSLLQFRRNLLWLVNGQSRTS